MTSDAKKQGRPPSRTKAAYANLPLVYSCSGCSDVAQLANSMAVRLDREKLAEMSCIAGVGGGVRALVKTACSGRKILALDGCPLHCVRHCLEQVGVSPTVHVDLSRAGVKKSFHADPSPNEAKRVWAAVILPAIARLRQDAP
jgi:uncharacterized metal-binding protein